MSLNMVLGIAIGVAIGLCAYAMWSKVALVQVDSDRYAMRRKIRFYLRTGAITPDMAAELTEKIWSVDVHTHAHYIRTFRDPRVLYPSELSW